VIILMTAPTYRAFRQLAISQGWTPKDLAPFVQADEPEKAAERILYHLAGVVSSQTGFAWMIAHCRTRSSARSTNAER
jgi:hypothetical protein